MVDNRASNSLGLRTSSPPTVGTASAAEAGSTPAKVRTTPAEARELGIGDVVLASRVIYGVRCGSDVFAGGR